MPSKYLNDARTGELIQKIYTADRAIATECKSYTDTNYLPLAGGTITGNLTVSGTITGDVTGDVTGNADSATNDANGNPIASTYLPLAGGTMTGRVNADYSIGCSTNDILLNLQGGVGTDGEGAYLKLFGADNSSAGGWFSLASTDGANNYTLQGTSAGLLQWKGKDVEIVNASGSNYIRYENGLQICWGTTANKTVNAGTNVSTAITFPVAFKDTNYTVTFIDRYNANNWQNHTMSTSTYSTTGVNLYLQNNANGAYTFGFSWMAIGKWK